MIKLRTYAQWNNLLGVAVGAIALLVYVSSIEPTASYWDCGEFIAVSYKLEVPHPPGAPLYLMLGRLFSMFAGDDTARVAYWVNMLSVVSSALTIVFLFWTITSLGRRLTTNNTDTPQGVVRWKIFGSGLLGALALTFSDSFWFSAVEAEVYGLSSLFTAVIVWAILRWERIADAAQRSRWLLLIAYLIGLSIGVHLLGLLALPALALLLYYRSLHGRPARGWGEIGAIGAGLLVIACIMLGIIQGLPAIAAGFDIFFVNTLGLPFYSGIFTFSALLIGALVYGLVWAQKQRKRWLSTTLLGISFILLGYASYALVLIRSLENPPIDENNPEDVLRFLAYLKREQYGDRPLVYGPQFWSESQGQERSDPVYRKDTAHYEIAEWTIKARYAAQEKSFLPRLYSERHAKKYKEYLGLSEGQTPRSIDNLRFLFGYQIGHMYVRYLMWNFSGRASDEKDAGWLSPLDITFSSPSPPASLAKNKARNNYWALPFLFGLAGLFFHAWRDGQGFRFVMLLFLLMGLGLVLYLNMPPDEPRERDYIYAGSYYAFSIWIGLSFYACSDMLGRWVRRKALCVAASGLLCLLPITLMATQNWDDHNRSGRYFSIDSARNLLESCAPNAILFTGGDNDTFPLWYAQEVEGIRTDVRVVVLSYFNTDWYIQQMMRPSYLSAPLPFTLPASVYAQGALNDILAISPRKELERGISLSRYLDLVRVSDPRIQLHTENGAGYNLIPSRRLILEIDTAKLNKAQVLLPPFDSLLADRIPLALKGNYIEKKDLAILDLLSAQNWERPLYFNSTSIRNTRLNMLPHVVQEGLAYRFLPIIYEKPAERKISEDDIAVDADRMYENIRERFSFRGLDDPEVYLSKDYRSFALNHRSMMATAIAALQRKGDKERALELFKYSLEKIPPSTLLMNEYSLPMLDVALWLEEWEEAKKIGDAIIKDAEERIHYTSLDGTIRRELRVIQQSIYLFIDYGRNKEAEAYKERLHNLLYAEELPTR